MYHCPEESSQIQESTWAVNYDQICQQEHNQEDCINNNLEVSYVHVAFGLLFPVITNMMEYHVNYWNH